MHLFTFVLFTLVSQSIATGIAGAYERMLIWNAYRMCIIAYGPDQQFILPDWTKDNNVQQGGSHGTSQYGGSTFDEFLDKLNGPPAPVPPILGRDELYPDVHATAQLIVANPSQTRFFSQVRMLGNPPDNKVPEFPAAIDKLTKIMTDARKTAISRGDVGKISTFATNIQTAVKSIITIRSADQLSFQVDYLKDKGYAVFTRRETIAGRDFEVLDIEKTISSTGNLDRSNLKILINGFGKANAGDSMPTKENKAHWHVIKAWKTHKGFMDRNVLECGRSLARSVEEVDDVAEP